MTLGALRIRSVPAWPHARPPSAPATVWVLALLVGLAMLLPLAYLLTRSVGANSEAWDLLFRPRTVQILGRSLLLVATVTIATVALALPLAWLTTRTDLPLRRLWAVVTVLPLVIPSYVGGFLVVSALGPRGLLQQVLAGPFGVDRLPDIHGLPGAILTLSLLSYPYVLLTVRSSLANADPALEESARSLGHGSWSTFRHVTLPQLRPGIAAGALLVALYVLSDFGAVSLLGYETFTWAIFQQYQASFDRSVASLLSLVLVVVALGLVLAEARARGRRRHARTGPGAPRAAHRVALGGWKWPAVSFMSLVAAAALVLPMGVLVYWVGRGTAAGETMPSMWGAALNSVYVSGLAAITAVACSIPVAWMIVRHPGVFSRVVERASFVGYALPGVVVALALVFFGVTFLRPAYQTVWLLVFAYVVLFLPAALGATRSSLLQVSPKLEEAARGLGRRPAQVLANVTVPLMSSGMLMGGVLVFLIAMKELPATLILGPLGFKTLSTAVWSASSEAFFAQAAAPALLLILLSSVPIAILFAKDGRLRSAGTGVTRV